MFGKIFLSLFTAVCAVVSPAAAGEKLSVFATIEPIAWLCGEIGGAAVEVGCLIPPGVDPHTYELRPAQMMALSKADIYFSVDTPFEKRLTAKIRMALPDLKIIDAAKGIKPRRMDCGHHDCGHQHENYDPHVWMSIPNLKVIAANICAGLKSASAADSAVFESELEKFTVAADAADREIGAELKPFKGASFFVFHPAFGYFAERYGLRQEAVETGGKAPAPRQLRHLIQKAKADKVRIIFVQPQFGGDAAEIIARAIDGRVETLNPLAGNPLENQLRIAKAIASAMAARHE